MQPVGLTPKATPGPLAFRAFDVSALKSTRISPSEQGLVGLSRQRAQGARHEGVGFIRELRLAR